MNSKELQELNEDLGTCTMVVVDQNTILMRDLKKHRDFILQKCNIKAAVTPKNDLFYFENTHLKYAQFSKMETGTIDIPGGFNHGFFTIGDRTGQKIYLIGGQNTPNRILKFNVEDRSFKELPTKLNVERSGGHMCALIPNTNKIMITGGYNNGYLDSTEILDTEDGSVTMIASPMNSKRDGHGMGVVTINGENKLAVFGGYDGRTQLDSVEVYNTKTEKWEMTDLELSEAKYYFGSQYSIYLVTRRNS